jgi:hypothetical protein
VAMRLVTGIWAWSRWASELARPRCGRGVFHTTRPTPAARGPLIMAFHGEKVRRQFLEMLISHNPSQAAKHVEAGPDYTIVITKRGEIYACGQNAYGQFLQNAYS